MINSPLDIPGSNCVVWLDATDTTTLSSLSGGAGNSLINTSLTGDFVGGWGDKSGNNRHFTNIGGSATTRPTWISSLSTVRFDGSNDYLSSFFDITYTAQTFFIVCKGNTTNSAFYTQKTLAVSDADQTVAGTFVPLVVNDATTWAALGAAITFSPRNPSTLYDLVTIYHTGSQATSFLNGSLRVSVADVLNYSVGLSRVGARISTNSVAGNFLLGDISEVIVYNRALTDLERADVEYYLTRKWNFLNSIPRQVYAIQNGNWSDTNTWSVSGYGTTFGFPLSSDNVYSNTFTVTADQNVRVTSLQTTALSPNIAAGGTFAITQPNITLTVPSGFLGGTTACVTGLLSLGTSVLSGNLRGLSVSHVGNGELSIFGNVTGGSATAATNNGNGVLNVIGNVTGGTAAASYGVNNNSTGNVTVSGTVLGGTNATAYGAFNNSSGNLTIVGNISGSGTATGVINNSTGNIYVSAVNAIRGGTATNIRGIRNSGVGNVYITGNCLGGTNASSTQAVLNESRGTVIINGNVNGSTGPGVEQSSISTGTLLISGTITASPNAHGVVSSNNLARNEFTGTLVNSISGRQAVYCAKYLVHPKMFDSATVQAVDRSGTYVTYYAPEAYSTSYVPHVSSVAVGTAYAAVSSLSGVAVNIPVQLSGTMVVPSVNSVAYGTSVGITNGIAINSIESVQQVWNTNINTLTAANSLGARLKNAATVQEVGQQIQNLNL